MRACNRLTKDGADIGNAEAFPSDLDALLREYSQIPRFLVLMEISEQQ